MRRGQRVHRYIRTGNSGRIGTSSIRVLLCWFRRGELGQVRCPCQCHYSRAPIGVSDPMHVLICGGVIGASIAYFLVYRMDQEMTGLGWASVITHSLEHSFSGSHRGRGVLAYLPARQRPASATVISPVIFRDAGPARNITTSAMSSAVDAICNGTIMRTASRNLSAAS